MVEAMFCWCQLVALSLAREEGEAPKQILRDLSHYNPHGITDASAGLMKADRGVGDSFWEILKDSTEWLAMSPNPLALPSLALQLTVSETKT